MIQWMAFKAFVKKAWVWIKHYWYFPVMILIGVVAWCAGRRDTEGILKAMAKSKESYEKEVKILKETHAQEIAKRDSLIDKHQEALNNIEKEYKIKLSDLDANKKEDINKTVEEFKDNPEELAKRVSDIFGIDHVE